MACFGFHSCVCVLPPSCWGSRTHAVSVSITLVYVPSAPSGSSQRNNIRKSPAAISAPGAGGLGFCWFSLFCFLLRVLFITGTFLGSRWGCFTPKTTLSHVLSSPLTLLAVPARLGARWASPRGRWASRGRAWCKAWASARPADYISRHAALRGAAGSSGEEGAKPFAYIPRHAPAAALRGERSAERPRRLPGSVVPAAVGRSGRAAGGDVASVT